MVVRRPKWHVPAMFEIIAKVVSPLGSLKINLQRSEQAQMQRLLQSVSIPPEVLFLVNDECQELHPDPPLQIRDQDHEEGGSSNV